MFFKNSKKHDHPFVCKTLMKQSQCDSDACEKYGNYLYNGKKLLLDIELKDAHKSVLKYIAPHFQVNL